MQAYRFNSLSFIFLLVLSIYFDYVIRMKQEKIKMQKKEVDKPPQAPVYWIEISDSISHRYQFEPDGQLSVSSLFIAKLFPLYLNPCEYQRLCILGSS